jgi:hypothetical protein
MSYFPTKKLNSVHSRSFTRSRAGNVQNCSITPATFSIEESYLVSRFLQHPQVIAISARSEFSREKTDQLWPAVFVHRREGLKLQAHRLLQGARLDFSQDALLFQEIPEVTSAMGSFVHNFGDIVFYVSSTNQVRPAVFFAAS